MPETDDLMVVTVKQESWVPASVSIYRPGTEEEDEDGNPVPATGELYRFRYGHTHRVPRDVGELVVQGGPYQFKRGMAAGEQVLDYIAYEGPPESSQATTESLSEELADLRAKFQEFMEQAEAEGVDAADVLKDADEETGVTAEDTENITITDGKYDIDPDTGAYMCPSCDYSTNPADEYERSNGARQALEMHIRGKHGV